MATEKLVAIFISKTKKGYYNSKLPGTKFCRPDYDLIKENLTMSQYEELKNEISQQFKMHHNAVEDEEIKNSDNFDNTFVVKMP